MCSFWGWVFLGLVIWAVFEKDKLPALKKKANALIKQFSSGDKSKKNKEDK